MGSLRVRGYIDCFGELDDSNLWRTVQDAPLGIYAAGTTIEGPAGCADAAPRNYCLEHDVTVQF